MNNTNAWIHPLFDPEGLYRLGTHYSVWDDGGVNSVCQFFEQLRRESLQSDWARGVPSMPQQWGFEPDFNQAIHEYLLASHTSKESIEKSIASNALHETASADSGYQMAAGPAETKLGLLQVNLSEKEEEYAVGDLGFTDWYFTGCGSTNLSERDKSPRMESVFNVEIPVPAIGHKCMLLIVRRSLLEQLAFWLDADVSVAPSLGGELQRKELKSAEDICKVLEILLKPKTLAPDSDEQYRQAGRVAAVLSCAPGLQGTSHQPVQGAGARFKPKAVCLERLSPILSPDTTVLFCLGPKEATQP